ncbi:RecQ family ATP-dependent DNA helicase [Pseudomonas aeruginosa]
MNGGFLILLAIVVNIGNKVIGLDDELRSTLKRIFGFDDLRPQQKPIVSSVMSGNDMLALMKTSGGKSLCYQLPAVHKGGTTIVLSPLISLMVDQVYGMEKIGVKATFVNSSITDKSEVADRYRKLAEGYYSLFYVSPERLKDPAFLHALVKAPVHTFVIDEAHCASEWGHNFRPSYAKIGPYLREIEAFLKRPIQRLALTATANAKAQRDIIKMLDLHNPDIHIQDFDRENITYHVVNCENRDRRGDVLSIIQQHPDECIIVYCVTVKEVERVAEFLNENNVEAGFYHGKLDSEEKAKIQSDFKENRVKVLVATSAFGMGVDKPDVRLVIHAQMPGSVEGWYQEAGRAGRDGAPCQAILLYHYSDKDIHRYFISLTNPSSVKIPPIKETIKRILAHGPARFNTRHIALQVTRQQSIIQKVLPDASNPLREITEKDVRATISLLVKQNELVEYDGAYDIGDWSEEDDYQWVEEVRRNDWIKFNAMCALCETHLCRRWQILNYFDEKKPHTHCGNCDNCHKAALTKAKNGHHGKSVRPSTLISLANSLQSLQDSQGSRWVHVLLGTLPLEDLTPKEADVYERFAWNAVRDIESWRKIILDNGIISENNSLTERGKQWVNGELVIDYREQPPAKDETSIKILTPEETEIRLKAIRSWRRAYAYREELSEIQILNEPQLRKLAAIDDVNPESLAEAGFSPSWIRSYAKGVIDALNRVRNLTDVVP